MADDKRVSSATIGAGPPGPEELAAIPLIEERLSVAKRRVETGRVRVHVTVEEHQETVTEQVLRDDLQIERIPKNVRVKEAPRVRLEGDTTIVPVVKEVVVVEKALMLVEEIRICRRSIPETTEIPVSLRRESARIEREPSSTVPEAAE